MRVCRRVAVQLTWLLQQQPPQQHRSIATNTRSTTATCDTRKAWLRQRSIEAVSNEVFAAGNVRMRTCVSLTSLPEGVQSYPEVCFIGKPNVGKSTIVSCLLHNATLAPCGRKGGTTRALQFYNVGDALLLVDTPGYGSWAGHAMDARHAKQASALAMLFRYLALRKEANLRHVYWVMEANAHGPVRLQPRDVELRDFLARERIAYTVLLSKMDRHWTHYVKRQRSMLHMRRDGAYVPPSRLSSSASSRNTSEAAVAASASVEAGIARNIHEVQAFLRDTAGDVPVLAVRASRRAPRRCFNMTRLQHDIVRHCCDALPPGTDVTAAQLRSLRYAPPHADDVERLQLRYPVEAFVLPDDDNVTLADMVRQHEEAKAHYLAQRHPLLLPRLRLSPHAALAQRARQEQLDTPRRTAEAVAALPTVTHGSDQAAAPQLLSSSSSALPVCDDDTTKQEDDNGSNVRSDSCVLGMTASSGRGRGGSSSVATCQADATAPQRPSSSSSSSAALPLPFALDEEAVGVCAINGVCIPRTLIPLSVRHAAAASTDEKAHFALLYSGASAYETLLRSDHAAHGDVRDGVANDGSGGSELRTGLAAAAAAASPSSPLPSSLTSSQLLFTQTEAAARVSATALERHGAPRVHSAAWRRRRRVLMKYVARRRKMRSVQLHAQGYMCPWLASSGQAQRNSVVGLPSQAAAYVPGRGGARLSGRRESGFGGRSHSAHTLRQHGRATNRVGFWAA